MSYEIRNRLPMPYEAKRDKIKELAASMLAQSQTTMLANIEKALRSGAIDIDAWDADNNPMILPKSILVAVLQSESEQYDCGGTSFAKEVKSTVKNLRHFI